LLNYWPSKVNRRRGGAGPRPGGPREGAESVRRAAAVAREARRPRRGHCEPSRADRHPALARDSGRRRGPAGPAALQPMELENIVANTVLLKAREGEATRRAPGPGEPGLAASELHGAPQPLDPLGPWARQSEPHADTSPSVLSYSSSAPAPGSWGPGRDWGQAAALAAGEGVVRRREGRRGEGGT
jgi:hypothetical protein